MKNLLKKLTPFVLAGSLVAQGSKAQDHYHNHPYYPGHYSFDPFHTHVFFEPHPHIYYHDDSFPHIGLHIIDGTLRALLYSQLIDESRARSDYYNKHNQRNRERYSERDSNYRIEDPTSIPQTFIANYWRDSDGNRLKNINEMVGLNKKTFTTNESLTYGMHLPIRGIGGKTYEIKFLKEGNLVHCTKGRFDEDNETLNVNWKPSVLSKIVSSHGNGIYSVEFYLDKRHWNTKDFNLVGSVKQESLVSVPETFLCRWEDSDKNGRFDYNELKERGKRKFLEGERLALFTKSDKKNHVYEVKIFDENDKLVRSWESSNDYGEVLFYNSELEPGRYYAVFKIDKKYKNDINFEIVPKEKPTNQNDTK